MNNRLFHHAAYKQQIKVNLPVNDELNEETHNPLIFACLEGKDVVTAMISDHDPVIHDGVLFWNIMMQGKRRNGENSVGYNNGFRLVENENAYIKRLEKTAQVIAEIINRYPAIDIISLCEGPIVDAHVAAFIGNLRACQSMQKFFIDSSIERAFHKPETNGLLNWGLMMLADKSYNVNEMQCDLIGRHELRDKLAYRFQIWKLTNKECIKYLALGHFPFGKDEKTLNKENLSEYGDKYCNLVKDILVQYENDQFILCADFNFNPYLISAWNDRVMDQIPINNSIILDKNNKEVNAVTVDGILLSKQEKQKFMSMRFNPGLFSRLTKEHALAVMVPGVSRLLNSKASD